jgi:two-component system sensor histidine kinase YesM
MKLSQRMILVYMAGCILPLVCVCLYMYGASKQALVEQELANESTRLCEQADKISQSMEMAIQLSDRLYYDEDVEKVAMIQYANTAAMKVDYREFDLFSEYLEQYYEDVSGICLYLETEGKVDNHYFKLLTEGIKEKSWYQRTIEAAGEPVWSYFTNGQTGKRSLRLTRILYNADNQNSGVMSITLKPEISDDFVARQESNTLLLLNGTELVHSNFSISDKELDTLTAAIGAKSFDGWLEFEGERCIVSTAEIAERYSSDTYTFVSITPYREVTALANKSAWQGLFLLFVCVGMMTLVIIFLGNWFSNRISAFSRVMHRAAQGDFTAEDPNIDKAQDEIWQLNRDLHVMIGDIQKLMDQTMQDKIQKEQLYSRQKDAELKMLAAQINPHFLYNTLENIRMMASIEGEKDIADLARALTKFLRSALDVGGDLKTLAWEMDMVESYIKIQNYRFGDRIHASVCYDREEAQQYMIIPFVVQPFVENAYVHGIEEMEENGQITVRVEIAENLCLYIEDNGKGMSPAKVEEMTRYINDFENLDRTHIGICNVNQRIRLKFGEEYGVDFRSEPGTGTQVKLCMPIVGRDANF